MSSSAWRDLERRVGRQFGTTRTWVGEHGSDLRDCAYSVECKRSKRGVPEGRWIEQARRQGRNEGKPWCLVVAKHHDRNPIVVCELHEFLRLAREAGALPQIEEAA